MSDVKSVCVYCGSSNRVADIYKDSARMLGRELATRGIGLVYGGGRVGLMGLVADAVLEAGGDVVGVIPIHLQEKEVGHVGLTELHVVDSMHTRKRMMMDRSDAFVALPGGLGTLEELFEVLTWKQLRLHDKPIVVLNVDGFWDSMLAMIDHIVEAGFAQPGHRDMYTVVNSVDGLFAALARAPQPVLEPETKWL